MSYARFFDLRASDFKAGMEQVLAAIPRTQENLPFLLEADLTVGRFHMDLLAEENASRTCPVDRAAYRGERVLILLDQLFHRIRGTAENHRLIIALAVGTGAWIARRGGEIREFDLIVSGIATFANEARRQEDLLSLYEVSLQVMDAADAFIKADTSKQDPHRAWRLLCLNHCIIATRSGQGGLAKDAYDRLVAHLPEEAPGFFRLGMEKIQTGRFTQPCRDLIQAYYQMFCADCRWGGNEARVLN